MKGNSHNDIVEHLLHHLTIFITLFQILHPKVVPTTLEYNIERKYGEYYLYEYAKPNNWCICMQIAKATLCTNNTAEIEHINEYLVAVFSVSYVEEVIRIKQFLECIKTCKVYHSCNVNLEHLYKQCVFVKRCIYESQQLNEEKNQV